MATREIPDSSSMREKYPSNSYKNRDKVNYAEENVKDSTDISAERKEVRKVADARIRKQGLVRRLAKSIIEDSIETARERAIEDIIVPGFKALIFDTITEMFDVMLFGGGGERPYRASDRRYSSRQQASKTSYTDYYRDGVRNERGNRRESLYKPDDIIVDTRVEARNALDELDLTIRKYGQASVADFYDIVGVTGDWTDNQYGWTNLRGATIKPVRDGFMIVLPRTKVLKD